MKDYRSTHLVKYEEPKSVSYTSIECLQFLKGSLWNQGTLNYVHALRPSSIRVTEGCMKMDSRIWRVTVIINKDGIIKKISQEVEVGCIGFKNASDMDNAYGII